MSPHFLLEKKRQSGPLFFSKNFIACISVGVYTYCERISVAFVLTTAIQFKTTSARRYTKKAVREMLIIASHGRYVLLCVSLCSDIYDLLLNSLRIFSRLIRTAVGAFGINDDNIAVVDHPAVAVYFKRPSALLFFQYEVFFLSIGRMCGYLNVITMYKIPKRLKSHDLSRFQDIILFPLPEETNHLRGNA